MMDYCINNVYLMNVFSLVNVIYCTVYFSLAYHSVPKIHIICLFAHQPASFVALREWGSDDETLTEVCLSPVSPSIPVTVRPPDKEPTQHKLPLPEQRVLALSLRYPPELVPIDVSGTSFKRLEKFRQSLIHVS